MTLLLVARNAMPGTPVPPSAYPNPDLYPNATLISSGLGQLTQTPSAR